jgi:hypothetical protein
MINAKKIKVAIITRPDYKSPRILAESLAEQFKKNGSFPTVYFEISRLTRLKKILKTPKTNKKHFYLRTKYKNFFKDFLFLKKLKKYDLIVICECTPNGFWKNTYHIEELKDKLKIPVYYYEVYYLGNTPSQIDSLIKQGNPTIERYDHHLCVSEVTEIIGKKNSNWSCIGLDMMGWGLTPLNKNEFIAVVDFIQEGFEEYHKEQVNALKRLGIKFIVLDKTYSISEIRKIYNSASIFFLQFPEAFGVSIAECLAAGCQIFTPNMSWPMSWRLNSSNDDIITETLPSCFTAYDGFDDLLKKLNDFFSDHNLETTPINIFQNFINNYPNFYFGNPKQIQKIIDEVSDK